MKCLWLFSLKPWCSVRCEMKCDESRSLSRVLFHKAGIQVLALLCLDGLPPLRVLIYFRWDLLSSRSQLCTSVSNLQMHC